MESEHIKGIRHIRYKPNTPNKPNLVEEARSKVMVIWVAPTARLDTLTVPFMTLNMHSAWVPHMCLEE